ncbi:hypothetical protein GQ55_6G216900 [Panicum hallii var. hallii]|uniref:Replication factor-A protein 1 N-terminal domain-containing protein n=1 Tax=Panicum hallii var. hallii TaxID=1504633 RepID=A0A2T7D853_9POAL|nr:hypothetical protein GQ55_6G216900 [Panicum hallii var. hallii]
MEALLTRGAVAAIAASKVWEVAPAAQRAVLQVVEVSWVAEPPVGLDGCCLCRPSTETHRMVLSDGVHTLGQFSLSTPLKHYVEDGHIRKGTVLRLLVFCCNVCSTDKTIIYEFEVL